MSVSVFDHPWLAALFGDDMIAAEFAAERTLARMVRIEAALTAALGQAGVIDAAAVPEVLARCATFQPDTAGIAQGVARDGVPVPALVWQMKAHLGPELADHLHRGATSQDLVDTAVVLALVEVNRILADRLTELVAALEALEAAQGANALMGRTRMQAAVPITAGDRIAAWRLALEAHLVRLGELLPRVELVQFGGAAGTRSALGDKGGVVARALAAELGLGDAPRAWHTRRDALAEYASWLSLVTGSLGKLGQDVALMAQNELAEVALRGGGGSSAMPHKQNPVQAELLVTLARFNAVQVSGMHQALVHEQERSGAAWSLEWMLLPPMAVAAGAATRTALELIAAIDRIGTPSP